jgi:hypothetical protein
MKNITLLFLAIFMFSITSAFGQKNCKYDYEKEDPFTGKATKGTTCAIYPASPISYEYWYVGLNRVGDDYYMGMVVELNGELNLYVNQGDSIMFKLADGNIITIHANDQGTPVSKVTTAGSKVIVTTQYRVNYDISVSDMKKLTESMVTYVRMNLSDKIYEKELKEKRAKDFMNDALCIMN